MNMSFVFRCFCLLVLLSVTAACTKQDTDTASIDAVAEDLLSEEEELTPNEAEELLPAELSELEQLGEWESLDAGRIKVIRENDNLLSSFPIEVNKQVEFYLDLFQGRLRPTFQRWLSRSGKYRKYIDSELEKAGLPRELWCLAMIESGFNPSALSRAKAVGLWQFIRGTGKNYGLNINRWIDERRDPEKATSAAVAYLSKLYNDFGDWYLAVAAYNAGEGKIQRAIEKYDTRDFWQLAKGKYLKPETKGYVPKLIATIIIASDPESYGFTDIKYQNPIAYETVEVKPNIKLSAIAAASSADKKLVYELNNELRKRITPPGKKTYKVKIPAGKGDTLLANLKRLHPVVAVEHKIHVVRRGENISRIARRYRIKPSKLMALNKLRSTKIMPGQRLKVPYTSTEYVLLDKNETPADYYVKKESKPVYHKIKKGETLSYLARKYKVSVANLKRWNNISSEKKLIAGKKIVVYGHKTKSSPAGRKSIVHVLQKGETLGSLANKYKVPVASLMKWNQITNARRLRSGRRITVYLPQEGKTAISSTASVATKKKNRGLVVVQNQTKKKVSAQTHSADVTWYVVQSGDSMWTIARKFKVSVDKIRKWNDLNSDLLRPGKRLIVGI